MSLIKKNTSASKRGAIGRLLITVNVVGSTGPLRFLVNQEDLVAAVIQKSLRLYARQGRLPVMGSDPNDFALCCANSEWEALRPWETIGSHGIRDFILYRNPEESESKSAGKGRNGIGSLKTWLHRSLNFKISSH